MGASVYPGTGALSPAADGRWAACGAAGNWPDGPARSRFSVDAAGECSDMMMAESGHPQAARVEVEPPGWRRFVALLYSGRLVLAWVALQLRTVKGESMLISKWRRRVPVGSSGSDLEMRRTIWFVSR